MQLGIPIPGERQHFYTIYDAAKPVKTLDELVREEVERLTRERMSQDPGTFDLEAVMPWATQMAQLRFAREVTIGEIATEANAHAKSIQQFITMWHLAHGKPLIHKGKANMSSQEDGKFPSPATFTYHIDRKTGNAIPKSLQVDYQTYGSAIHTHMTFSKEGQPNHIDVIMNERDIRNFQHLPEKFQPFLSIFHKMRSKDGGHSNQYGISIPLALEGEEIPEIEGFARRYKTHLRRTVVQEEPLFEITQYPLRLGQNDLLISSGKSGNLSLEAYKTLVLEILDLIPGKREEK